MVENSQCLQGLFWTLLTLFDFSTLLLVSCFALQFWPQHRPLAPPWQPGDHSHLPCLPLYSCSWQFLTMNSSVSCVGLLLDDSCQMWPRSLSKCCNESERFLTFPILKYITIIFYFPHFLSQEKIVSGHIQRAKSNFETWSLKDGRGCLHIQATLKLSRNLFLHALHLYICCRHHPYFNIQLWREGTCRTCMFLAYPHSRQSFTLKCR